MSAAGWSSSDGPGAEGIGARPAAVPRVVFVGGKGGVGKTSTAAALAWLLAAAGRRVLLVSTDPAHSLGHLFGRAIGDAPVDIPMPAVATAESVATAEGAASESAAQPTLRAADGSPTPGDIGRGRLQVLEIDPRASAQAHVQGVAALTRDLVAPELREAVDRHLALSAQAPGALEAATLERLARLLVDEEVRAQRQAGPPRRRCWQRSRPVDTTSFEASAGGANAPLGAWDHIVVDTAPTGHTAQLLAAPEAIGAWLDALARRRARARRHQEAQDALGGIVRTRAAGSEPDDATQGSADDLRQERIAAILADRQRVLHALGHVLRDPARCAFLVVTTPERLPVLESVELLDELRRLGVGLAGIVVNRVRSEPEATAAVEPLANRHPGRELLFVPEQPHPPVGTDAIARLAADLAPVLPWDLG
ncbi:arsenite-transporting ATPase [Kineosphaera limosa]|uniref:Arsenite-transporting ATPase n=1 Tax=Kineosphaera limosa NBRC 100340 TaxID=1184609 RepID=K6WU07_9MICO|nr:ArsA family ATPase [Kineosphaera limosa]NYD99642.1 arsenite-transporting ATPase [Kineosphaera limosa]GAB95597.1 arsenite-transporting ATPase [Kineosphaera limosa NBRC 100340]